MKPKSAYLALCLAGVLVPYWQFVPWLAQHGLNLGLFVRELFATRIGAFFGMDVVVSAVALLVFSGLEGARLRIRGRWLVVLAVLTVGVSLGLPLFLYLRKRTRVESGLKTRHSSQMEDAGREQRAGNATLLESIWELSSHRHRIYPRMVRI